MILSDGEVRSKNHPLPQRCHQTSYEQIVGFRDTPAFNLPHGGVVNDYVPFYFSPITAFTLVIHRGGVEVKDANGNFLGMSSVGDRLFLVYKVTDLYQARLRVCFSDYALNSLAPLPSVVEDLNRLESHVKWHLFDEAPITAGISEIGYPGACQFFQDMPTLARQNRKSARMAELLVRDSVPTSLLACIVAPSEHAYQQALSLSNHYGFHGPVLKKPGCFVS